MSKALERACKIVGSKNKMAIALGVTRQAVQQWFDNAVPPERARDIEIATGGKVKRAHLRPDVFA